MMGNIDWSAVFSLSAKDVVKVVLTAFVILFVTKIQLVSDKLSALLIALPLTSLVAMMWMHAEGQSAGRIAGHAESTFWFVLPTLPMFLVLPWMLRSGWGFPASLALNCLLTMGLFWTMVWIGKRFGVDLI